MPLLYTAPMNMDELLISFDFYGANKTILGSIDEVIEHQKQFKRPQTQELSLVKQYLDQSNVFVVGDLHGNFLKLIGALVQCGFIRISEEHIFELHSLYDRMDPMRHQTLPKALYKRGQNHAEQIKTNIKSILNRCFFLYSHQQSTKEIVFCGDTLFDRGHSDFVTLCIFDWMREAQISYRIIFGNHELRMFHQNSFFINSPCCDPGSMFQSFDYWRVSNIPGWREVFLQMFKDSWLSRVNLYLKFCEHRLDCIFLSHAPVSETTYIGVFNDIKSRMRFVFGDKNFNDDHVFNYYIRQILFMLLDNKYLDYKNFCTGLNEWTSFLQLFLEKLLGFCEKRLYSMPEGPFFDNFTHSPYLRQRMDSIVFMSRDCMISLSMRLSDCNIFGHEGDIIPPSSHQICIDSDLGKPGHDDGMLRIAMLATTVN